LYALGWSYLKLALYPQAELTFDRLVSSSDALAHSGLFRRGIAEKFDGKVEKALATWGEVVRRAPQGEFSDNALYESGMLLYEQNKISEAKMFFERAARDYASSDVLADAFRMAGECFVMDSICSEFCEAVAV
jgi:TolA-binding protein